VVRMTRHTEHYNSFFDFDLGKQHVRVFSILLPYYFRHHHLIKCTEIAEISDRFTNIGNLQLKNTILRVQYLTERSNENLTHKN